MAIRIAPPVIRMVPVRRGVSGRFSSNSSARNDCEREGRDEPRTIHRVKTSPSMNLAKSAFQRSET